MMKNLLLILIVATIAACAAKSATPPGSGIYRGKYLLSADVNEFQLADTGERFWVAGDLDLLRKALTRPGTDIVGGTLVAKVEGDVSKPGRYGPNDAYSRQLMVRRVLRYRDVCRGSLSICTR